MEKAKRILITTPTKPLLIGFCRCLGTDLGPRLPLANIRHVGDRLIKERFRVLLPLIFSRFPTQLIGIGMVNRDGNDVSLKRLPFFGFRRASLSLGMLAVWAEVPAVSCVVLGEIYTFTFCFHVHSP
jgi:hypothetical protein